MRSFLAKAVAAAATLGLVTPAVADEGSEGPTIQYAAAFFKVKLNRAYPELIRLDVKNSEAPCDVNALSINNQNLSLGAHQVKKGNLKLDSGSTIEALWSVACVDYDENGQLQFSSGQYLPTHDHNYANLQPGVWFAMDILKVDGEDTDVGFEANFIQGGDYVKWNLAEVWPSKEMEKPDKVRMITHFGGEADWIVPWNDDAVRHAELELEALRAGGEPAQESWDIIEVDEGMDPAEFTPIKHEDAPEADQPQPVHEKCDDFACLMSQIKESMTIDEFKKIDAQAEELIKEILSKQTKKQKPLTSTTEDEATIFIMNESQNMKPIATADDISPDPVSLDTPTSTPTGLFLTALPPQDQDLLLTLFLAGTAFLLFTLISVFIFKSRPQPSIQRLPLHRETHEERLARVANRRAAVKIFFSRLFCGLLRLEEKDAAQPQGQDCRRQEAQEEGTMHQELESFREVADMVENMIAAEEGRNQQVRRQEVEAEVEPPSYESDAAESGVVADGFRYIRFGDETGEESRREGSDRLGYGNKD